MKIALGASLLLAASVIAPIVSQADSRSASRKAMVDIVASLEKQNFAPIVAVSFDDGVWEVEAYHEVLPVEVTIDARTGEIIAEHRDDSGSKPPADSMLLSELLLALEKAGYADVTEMSFERRSWEVEAVREGQKRELRVDPKDARIISDRVDD